MQSTTVESSLECFPRIPSARFAEAAGSSPFSATTIGAIQRGFFQEVRNHTFYALADLNAAFRQYLERFNASVMKDYGQSRVQRFAHEQTLLRPLPAARFERFDWRSAKVHPDCHVQVDKNFYSVPHRTIGQTVRVRVSDKLVEVFTAAHERLAAHARLAGLGRFSTDEQHYPDGKLSVRRAEVRSAQAEADRLGPKLSELVQSLFASRFASSNSLSTSRGARGSRSRQVAAGASLGPGVPPVFLRAGGVSAAEGELTLSGDTLRG